MRSTSRKSPSEAKIMDMLTHAVKKGAMSEAMRKMGYPSNVNLI